MRSFDRLTSYSRCGFCNHQILEISILTSISHSLTDVAQYRIAISGISELQSKFLERYCSAVGIVIEKGFKRSSASHLLCPSREGQKYEMALKWGVPVVDFEWVYTIGYPLIAGGTSSRGIPEERAMSDMTNSTCLPWHIDRRRGLTFDPILVRRLPVRPRHPSRACCREEKADRGHASNGYHRRGVLFHLIVVPTQARTRVHHSCGENTKHQLPPCSARAEASSIRV